MFEQYAGKFPLWLSPVQCIALTIADRHEAYAREVVAALRAKGIRAELDIRSESINKKVREAQLDQINYILVIGDKEIDSNTVNVRTRDNVVHGTKSVATLAADMLDEMNRRI
jgi:threonyl-tRNA synthetase